MDPVEIHRPGPTGMAFFNRLQMGTRIQALFPKISFEVYHRTEVMKVEPADKIDARVILFTGFHSDVYLFCLKL